MTWFHALAALFAAYMIVRHLPGAKALLSRDGRSRPMAVVAALNVLLAFAILAFAVKQLVGVLISR